MRKITITDENQMLEFAKEYTKSLGAGGVVFLYGDLGAGKTTFVRGVLRSLGYTGKVKSPTYTLVEAYEFDDFNIYHFDLYRLSDPEELEWLGIRDYFNEKSVCFIEWPEKGGSFLPLASSNIYIKYAEQVREIEIS